jgi:Tfp pilus assembly protein PilW
MFNKLSISRPEALHGLRRTLYVRQRGASMISVLLGLVISAVVVAVIYNQYTDSQRKARIDAAQVEISTMIASAQKLYGNTNQYGAVTTAIAVQSGLVPARLRVAGTNTAQNLYNGAITFAPATVTTTNDALLLTYSGVRGEDCQDLVLGTSALSRQINVAATTVKPADLPVVIATMSTACDATATMALAFTVGRGQ